MKYKDIFLFEMNWKTFIMLAVLAILPNFAGMINAPTVWGFKIHLFQYLVFIAAAVYGPFGGLISGGMGSLFTALMMNNPYIILGNMILGFFTGLFFRKGMDLILAVLFAYLIQMPWLWITDVFFAGMAVSVVNGVVIALLISDVIWAIAAKYSYKPLKRMLE